MHVRRARSRCREACRRRPSFWLRMVFSHATTITQWARRSSSSLGDALGDGRVALQHADARPVEKPRPRSTRSGTSSCRSVCTVADVVERAVVFRFHFAIGSAVADLEHDPVLRRPSLVLAPGPATSRAAAVAAAEDRELSVWKTCSMSLSPGHHARHAGVPGRGERELAYQPFGTRRTQRVARGRSSRARSEAPKESRAKDRRCWVRGSVLLPGRNRRTSPSARSGRRRLHAVYWFRCERERALHMVSAVALASRRIGAASSMPASRDDRERAHHQPDVPATRCRMSA